MRTKEDAAVKYITKSAVIANSLLALLLILIAVPGEKQVQPAYALILGILAIEVLYAFKVRAAVKSGTDYRVPSYVVSIVWIVLSLWELFVTDLNMLHPVLYPAPENVFYVFATQYRILGINILWTMELLLISILMGVAAGVILGVIVGWNKTLSATFYPIANVFAPIPSIVYAPYIISLMPSFRSASAMVIALGIFFPMFLNTVNRVHSIDSNIIDSAKMLNVSDRNMVTKVILPYVIPGVISGMKVTLTTSFMLLMFAEMMGATKGLGYYIVNYNTYGNYTNVIACIIVVGFVVTILSRMVDLLQKKIIRWKEV